MKIPLELILSSEQELQKLAVAALPAKTKYWAGRIVAVAGAAIADFTGKRNALIMGYGEQVVLYQPNEVETAKGLLPEWKLIEEGEDVTGKPTQWRVKAENHEIYVAEVTAIGDKMIVDLPCDRIKLEDFGSAMIDFDISKLEWMIDIGEPFKGLKVVGSTKD
jgi:hypothetical protein